MSEKYQTTSLYDPKTVSEMLGIPTATIRRYAVDWSGYLSEYAQRPGKKRRYTDRDVLILKRLREYIGQRKDRDEIAQLLLVVEPDKTSSALALLPDIVSEFESIRARFAAQDDQINQLRSELEEIKVERKRGLLSRLFGRK